MATGMARDIFCVSAAARAEHISCFDNAATIAPPITRCHAAIVGGFESTASTNAAAGSYVCCNKPGDATITNANSCAGACLDTAHR